MARWNPWRALRDREHIEFGLGLLPDVLGGGTYRPQLGWAAIVVDSRLDRRERAAMLAHELVHDERAGGCVSSGMLPGWDVVVIRDESAVDDEVARRLVPSAELRSFCDRQVTMEEGVEPRHVADYFDVADWVAERALHLMVGER